jgi:hypothetical protein
LRSQHASVLHSRHIFNSSEPHHLLTMHNIFPCRITSVLNSLQFLFTAERLLFPTTPTFIHCRSTSVSNYPDFYSLPTNFCFQLLRLFFPAEHLVQIDTRIFICHQLPFDSKTLTTCFSCAAKIVGEAITLPFPRQLEALVTNHILPILFHPTQPEL